MESATPWACSEGQMDAPPPLAQTHRGRETLEEKAAGRHREETIQDIFFITLQRK